MEKRLFTSECVTTGHPDKVADRISDSILDACLAQEVLRNGQMAGAGDGQELRQALDQAQQDG